MKTIVAPTFVPGTPATYSTDKVAAWYAALFAVLAKYKSLGNAHPLTARYELDLHFIIDPSQYGNAEPFKTHGPDLDNLVKCTTEALALDNQGRGLGALRTDAAVYALSASKAVAAQGQLPGAWVTIRVDP